MIAATPHAIRYPTRLGPVVISPISHIPETLPSGDRKFFSGPPNNHRTAYAAPARLPRRRAAYAGNLILFNLAIGAKRIRFLFARYRLRPGEA
jgi:hypothetical protein